jgi:hypothetical protein
LQKNMVKKLPMAFLIKLKLFSIIKRKFYSDEDDKMDLENFQRKPERYSGQIAPILEEKMKSDNAFASEIKDNLKEIRKLC